ncbi:uncharacterized protein GIQ15_06685 [Arthroderma uncinatum]|uniref:uncharacterized protein n=1 Tax=Arthroderma uncinatum TaxID=74035 RepID=UPI00144AC3CC|nr:uncharacterized protein GIQ15_06685 [Arthroderma uncinatum]KAF3479709.1 hypothetical protein GIQ15_06685 [Arthroderma uncinatum]
MLSNSLTSSYLQYKEDTDVVASWLATTAKVCGYTKNINPGQQKQNQSGRLKGKARKSAQHSPGESSASKPSLPNLPTYTIAIHDFVPLAECIASCESPKVRVPATFAVTLERAISARRLHHGILGDRSKAKIDGHTYFISILERVQDTLRPLFSVEGDTNDNTDNMINNFEGLDVQEPSNKFIQAPDVTTPIPPTPDPEAKYKAELAKDLGEMYSAFCLLIKDYQTFRAAIMKTWMGYQQGVFDLVSASIMTNTALDFARQLEKDAKPLFDRFGGAEQVLRMVFLAQYREKGEDEAFKEQPGDDMNFRMWEASSGIFWPAYMCLQEFIPMVSKWNVPLCQPGFYGIYDPTSNREQKTPREKFKEDKVILTEIFSEFALLCLCAPDIVAQDELTRGLGEAFETHEITLSLVFATQVYLDIHHILRANVNRGLDDLMTTAGLIDTSIEQTLKHHQSLRVENWPLSNDRVLKNIQQQIEMWVKRDTVGEAKIRLNRPPGEPFKLLSSHPLLCGLMAYSLKATFQEVSVIFANAWGSIMYTYHLYNALRQEKMLQNKWPDMDIVMGMQGDVFVGDPPKTPEDYLKRFTLSMGWSATAFAKGRRPGTIPASSRGPRGLEELAPVAQMFKARFCEGSDQTDWTPEDIKHVVSKSNWDWDEEEVSSEGLSVFSITQAEKKKQTTTTLGQINAVELLERLRNAIQGESLELNIPYLTLHRVCWLVLRKVNLHCSETLQEMFGAGYLEKENQLPLVVGYIFMAATNTKKLGGLPMGKKSDVVTSKLMLKAAVIMDSCIEDAGRLCCNALEQHNIVFMDDSNDEDEDKDEA